MRSSRLFRMALLAVTLAQPAWGASTVCDAYRDLREFGIIGRTLFKAGVLGAYDCAAGANYDKPICTTKAKVSGFGLEGPAFNVPDQPLVATQTAGAAVVFSHPEAKNLCKDTFIGGDVVTGGGTIVTKGSEPPDILGTVDTTGTHPLVSSCSGAMLDMADISDAIRAAPAVLELESLTVPLGVTVTQLTVPPGGGIVRIGRLNMAGVRSTVQYGYNYECLYAPGYNEAAWLDITGDHDDDIVLDVGELSLGNCAFILMPNENFLINVAGPGRKVKVGVDVRGDYPINILAPERTVKVTGEKSYELGTYVGFIWADKVLMRGYTWPNTPYCED